MPSIRQQINIAAPTRVIWNLLTTAEGWTHWWAEEARLEPRSGGRIVLTIEGDDGEPIEERGVFHEIRPTRKLEIAWDSTSPAKTRGTRVQLTISRDGDEARLALIHSGGGILDDEEARAALEREWRSALRALRSHLESGSG
ncbi:MAG TPA: SRPBCC domain-containing protein [Deltaproteobacteria bacterium]|nr:SRPBCC domain-containing protein [Deltaproteobacteria bacterium]